MTPPKTTIPETHTDLLEAQVATLATIGATGYPQMTEVCSCMTPAS